MSIDQADARRQNFGQVRDAFCRVVNQESDNEVVRYDLTEDAAAETCMIFAEIYRNGGEWKFRAVGQGYASGLRGVATDFGIVAGLAVHGPAMPGHAPHFHRIEQGEQPWQA